MNFRNEWFSHVNEVHRKLCRKDKTVSRRTAMKEASISWPKKKEKLQRKAKRLAKAEAKSKET